MRYERIKQVSRRILFRIRNIFEIFEEILRVLLNFNPVVAQQSIRGLISATVKGQLKIIMLLLNYGIDPNQIELVNGTGPLHEAVRYNEIHDEMGRVERLKIVKILASFGANPDLVNLRNEVSTQQYI